MTGWFCFVCRVSSQYTGLYFAMKASLERCLPLRDLCLSLSRSRSLLTLLSLSLLSLPSRALLCLPVSPSLERLLSFRFSSLSRDLDLYRRSPRPYPLSFSLSSRLSRPLAASWLPFGGGSLSEVFEGRSLRSHIAELSVRFARLEGGGSVIVNRCCLMVFLVGS